VARTAQLSAVRAYLVAMDVAKLPRPVESCALLCVRCGAGLYYVRQDRARGIFQHRFECRRCGQRHAAWSYEWEPGSSPGPGNRPAKQVTA